MEARERYKSLLKIRSLKVRHQKQRKEAARLDKEYWQVGPSVLLQKAEMPSQVPISDEIGEFWKGIVGSPGSFDPKDEAILAWKGQMEDVECDHRDVIVDNMMWRDVITKMKSWKAPGPDAIHVFWWTIFPGAQSMLKGLIEHQPKD